MEHQTVGVLIRAVCRYQRMSTAGMYRRFARVKRLPRELVQVGSGASGGWFGKKDASKVLLYLHGQSKQQSWG